MRSVSVALLAALLALCASGAMPAPLEGAARPAAGDATVALFVRSCGECAADSYCEFAHPDATPDVPVACISYAKSGRALYRRYAAAATDCLGRPEVSSALYYSDDIGNCYNFVQESGVWKYRVALGACPGTFYDKFTINAASSVPGACFQTLTTDEVLAFSGDCSSFTVYQAPDCSTFGSLTAFYWANTTFT